jgi:hypothetical protein
LVKSDDLILVVSALRKSVDSSQGIVNGGVDAAAVKEAVVAAAVVIPSNDITFVVDALSERLWCAWIVEGSKVAASFAEPVSVAGAVVIVPNDPACIIDALSVGAVGGVDGHRIVDSGRAARDFLAWDRRDLAKKAVDVSKRARKYEAFAGRIEWLSVRRLNRALQTPFAVPAPTVERSQHRLCQRARHPFRGRPMIVIGRRSRQSIALQDVGRNINTVIDGDLRVWRSIKA